MDKTSVKKQIKAALRDIELRQSHDYYELQERANKNPQVKYLEKQMDRLDEEKRKLLKKLTNGGRAARMKQLKQLREQGARLETNLAFAITHDELKAARAAILKFLASSVDSTKKK